MAMESAELVPTRFDTVCRPHALVPDGGDIVMVCGNSKCEGMSRGDYFGDSVVASGTTAWWAQQTSRPGVGRQHV
jgi:hypothetical protein